MVRIIGALVGLGFALVLLLGLGDSIMGVINNPEAPSAEHEFHESPKHVEFASDGITGRFDRRQVQRGFQVYKEVCAACHSIHQVSFRDLAQLGYSEAEVKAIAAQWATEAPSVNGETGEAATRKNTPADRFPLVFANDVAARAANNNAVPPDLSLMAKARHEGPQYIYSLLTGYRNQVGYKNAKGEEILKAFPDVKTPAGLHFNPYFPNLNIAMAPPLTAEGQVGYTDGTRVSVDQMAKDVAAFLVWTAEPNLQKRHQVGWAALAFLAIFAALTYGAFRNIRRAMKH